MEEISEHFSIQPEIAVWIAKIDSRGNYQLEEVNLLPAPHTLDQASQMIPPGVYTTFRTFDGDKILDLSDHVNRLEESASLVGQPTQLRIGSLRALLREAVGRYPSQEKRVRLSVNLRNCDVYVLVESLQTPGVSDYALGVNVGTFRYKRQNPKAKQTQFIDIAQSIRKNIPPDIDDVLMTDEGGFILEGLNSNFFAVKQGEVFTAGENVLSGITREMVLRIIHQMDIPFHLSPIHITDIEKLEEAFLTSASRSILAVARIDEIKIEGLIPGPITASITDAYWKYVTARLEDL
jgi:branched-chain amino acid aminotransferase